MPKPTVSRAYSVKLVQKFGSNPVLPEFTRRTARKVRQDMADYCKVPWEALRKEGWRVVQVTITEGRRR